MVALKGKIVRLGECPLKKLIECEDCEYYDGWGVDIKNHRLSIWCFNNNIVDGKTIQLNENDVIEDNEELEEVFEPKKCVVCKKEIPSINEENDENNKNGYVFTPACIYSGKKEEYSFDSRWEDKEEVVVICINCFETIKNNNKTN